jgi:hypothetical protein
VDSGIQTDDDFFPDQLRKVIADWRREKSETNHRKEQWH